MADKLVCLVLKHRPGHRRDSSKPPIPWVRPQLQLGCGSHGGCPLCRHPSSRSCAKPPALTGSLGRPLLTAQEVRDLHRGSRAVKIALVKPAHDRRKISGDWCMANTSPLHNELLQKPLFFVWWLVFHGCTRCGDSWRVVEGCGGCGELWRAVERWRLWRVVEGCCGWLWRIRSVGGRRV